MRSGEWTQDLVFKTGFDSSVDDDIPRRDPSWIIRAKGFLKTTTTKRYRDVHMANPMIMQYSRLCSLHDIQGKAILASCSISYDTYVSRSRRQLR